MILEATYIIAIVAFVVSVDDNRYNVGYEKDHQQMKQNSKLYVMFYPRKEELCKISIEAVAIYLSQILGVVEQTFTLWCFISLLLFQIIITIPRKIKSREVLKTISKIP